MHLKHKNDSSRDFSSVCTYFSLMCVTDDVETLPTASAISSTVMPATFFRMCNPNVMFPLDLQQSALRHSVEGLLFYSYGHYTRPPAHITSLYLNNVFEWNCIEYSPFSRDQDSFCRSLVAGEISKRGYSVYNIDPCTSGFRFSAGHLPCQRSL